VNKVLALVLGALLVVTAVLAAEAVPVPPAKGALPFEVTPADALWGKPVDGVETQITVPVRRIATTETRLPVIVWFRNATKNPVTVLSVLPSGYAPHGEIAVSDPAGRNVIVGGCRKKHATSEIPLQPGQVRGFHCDAFRQVCHRKRDGDLPPGQYVVRMANSNSVTIEVVR
jgi:hypothetical protein